MTNDDVLYRSMRMAFCNEVRLRSPAGAAKAKT